MKLKRESDGRMFPTSDSSEAHSLIALLARLRKQA